MRAGFPGPRGGHGMHSGLLRRLFALMVSLALLLPPLALARELLAVGTDFPRIFERTAAGEYRGLGPDVLRQVLEPRGHSLRFASYPWARAQRMVELGQADILIGPYRSPVREARFAFVGQAFYRDRIVFYCRRARSCQWSGDFRQLAGQRIAVVDPLHGDQFEPPVDTQDGYFAFPLHGSH